MRWGDEDPQHEDRAWDAIWTLICIGVLIFLLLA